MTLLAAITIDASTTLRHLLVRIAGEADEMYVAIRRIEGPDTYWYTWTAEDPRRLAGLAGKRTGFLVGHKVRASSFG